MGSVNAVADAVFEMVLELSDTEVLGDDGYTCVLGDGDIARDETAWFVDGKPAHYMCGLQFDTYRAYIEIGHPEWVPSDLPSEWNQRLSAPSVATPVDYRDYLKTAVWREVRDEAIARAGGRCALCNADGPLQGHHRTYENLGHEEPGDVIALCRACHARHHRVTP